MTQIDDMTRGDLEAVLGGYAYYSGFYDAVVSLCWELYRIRGNGKSVEEFFTGDWWPTIVGRVVWLASPERQQELKRLEKS